MVTRLTTLMLAKDLSAVPRRKWFYLKRMACLVPAAAVVIIGLLAGVATSSTTVGLQMFQSLSVTALVVTLFLAATATGLPVLREKREKTLGLLFLTDMSYSHQVFGRLCAGVFFVALAVFSMFPLFVFCASLGGVSPAQIASAFIVIFGATFLGCSLGLFGGVVSDSDGGLVGRCVGLGFLILVLIPFFVSTASWSMGLGAGVKLPHIVSPFMAMFAIGRGRTFGTALLSCLVAVVAGIPFLLAARKLLPSHTVIKPKPVRRRRVAPLRTSARPPARGGVPPPIPGWAARKKQRRGLPRLLRAARAAGQSVSTIAGNPVTWKDLNFLYRAPRNEWSLCWLVSGLVALCVGSVSLAFSLAYGDLADVVSTVGISVGWVAWVFFFFGTVVRAARAFNGEKEGRTLELLLLTDLEDKEILWGKISAICRLALPWFVVYVGGVLLTMPATGFEGYSWMFFWRMIAGIGTALFYTALALNLSMRFKTVPALAICFAAYVLVEMIGKSLLMVSMAVLRAMGGIGMSMLGSTPLHLLLGAILLFRLRRNFRRFALGAI